MARYSYYKDVLGIEDINLLFGLTVNDSFITDKGYKVVCTGIEDLPSDDPYHDIEMDAIHLENEDMSEYGLTESFMYLEDSGAWILVDEYNM